MEPQLTSDTVLERLACCKDNSPNKLEFNFTQAAFERKVKTRVIDELIKMVSIEAFIEDVIRVEKQLNQGNITTIRELELELICAGKVSQS